MTIKSPTVILQRGILSIFQTIAIGATAATVALVGYMVLPTSLQPSSVLVSGIGIDDLLLA